MFIHINNKISEKATKKLDLLHKVFELLKTVYFDTYFVNHLFKLKIKKCRVPLF